MKHRNNSKQQQQSSSQHLMIMAPPAGRSPSSPPRKRLKKKEDVKSKDVMKVQNEEEAEEEEFRDLTTMQIVKGDKALFERMIACFLSPTVPGIIFSWNTRAIRRFLVKQQNATVAVNPPAAMNAGAPYPDSGDTSIDLFKVNLLTYIMNAGGAGQVIGNVGLECNEGEYGLVAALLVQFELEQWCQQVLNVPGAAVGPLAQVHRLTSKHGAHVGLPVPLGTFWV